MAITKYKVIKKNLDAVINYAMNGEKTENGILVSGINCLPQTAYSQNCLLQEGFSQLLSLLPCQTSGIFPSRFSC